MPITNRETEVRKTTLEVNPNLPLERQVVLLNQVVRDLSERIIILETVIEDHQAVLE